MSLRASIGLLCSAAFACGGGAPAQPSSGPTQPVAIILELPADDAIVGWRRSEAEQSFPGSGLYGHINGGAEIFLELGFEEVRLQSYRSGDDELVVEVYRMRDEIAAVGAYLANQGEPRRDDSLAARHRLGKHQLVFQKQRYYVLINNPAGNSELTPAMLEFARALAAQLPRSAVLPILEILPSAGRVAGSPRLIRGGSGLGTLYTLGEGDILLLGGKLTAVAARYRGADQATHLRIAVPYPSPAAAMAAFRNLVDNLDAYLEVIDKSEARLLFKDFAGKWGVATVVGERLDIRAGLASRP